MPAGSLRGLARVPEVEAEGVVAVSDLLRRLELA
jgi:hypothetical protein